MGAWTTRRTALVLFALVEFSAPTGTLAQNPLLTVGVAIRSDDTGNVGFDAELAAVVADRAGYTVAVQSLPANGIYEALTKGDIDAVLGSVALLADLPPGVAFTQTAVLNVGAVIVMADRSLSFHSLAELQRLTVGTSEASRWLAQLAAAGLADIRTFPDYTTAVAALMVGEIDAYYANRTVVAYWQHARGLDCELRVLDEYLSTDFPLSRLAVREDDLDLLARLDRAIFDLREMGVIFGGTFHYHPEEVYVAPRCNLDATK